MNMNKRLLISLALIIGVSVSAYAATQAFFVDVASNTASQFTVGTMGLNIDNGGLGFDKFDVSNIGVDGNISGGKTWTITNTGTIPGNLTFRMLNLVNNENGCEEPEAQTDIPGYTADTTCGNPGPGEGELGAAMAVNVTLRPIIGDPASDIAIVTNGDLTNDAVYATSWDTNAGVFTLPAGQSVEVTMNWATTPANYDNSIQSDSLTFDVAFQLDQVVPQ